LAFVFIRVFKEFIDHGQIKRKHLSLGDQLSNSFLPHLAISRSFFCFVWGALASAIQVTAGERGSFNLYSGFTKQQLNHPVAGVQPENELIDYAKHLCAEFRTDMGLWEHDHKAGRNDWHDTATYRMHHFERVQAWGLLVPPAHQVKKQPHTVEF